MDLRKATLSQVFDACQRTVASHKGGWKRCLELQAQDGDQFKKEFVANVNRVLLVWKREPSVERLCTFIVNFVTSQEQKTVVVDSDGGSLFEYLIRHLLDVSDAKDKAVRFRTSQMIAAMFEQLDPDTNIECVPRPTTVHWRFLSSLTVPMSVARIYGSS